MAILLRNKTTVFGLVADLAALTAADAAEEAARIAGDAALTTALGVEEAARIAGDATLTTNLAAEVTRATAAEGVLTTNLAAEVTARAAAVTAEADARIAADQALEDLIEALGSAFNYVGVLTGGVDSAAALDLSTLPAGQKDTGDYFKVTTAGYFKLGAEGTPFFANVNDGLVWNSVGTIDKIDNTNSSVQGVENFITVTGSTDTGFTVDVATTFKTRVTTLETDLASEIARATAAEAAVSAALAAEITARDAAETAQTTALQAYADAAAIAGGSIPVIQSLVVTDNKIVLANAPKNGVNGIMNYSRVSYIDEFNREYQAPLTLDATDTTGKTFIISLDVSGEWDTKSVLVQYLYVAGE